MMRKAARALTGLLLFATLAAPAAAIVDGQPDNGAHPNVGVMIVEIGANLPLPLCHPERFVPPASRKSPGLPERFFNLEIERRA